MSVSNMDAESRIKDLEEQIKILKHINQENVNLIKFYDTDALTGLLTKDAFTRETQKLLKKYPNETFIFMRYDIDKFQTVNSLFGYDEGDKLILYCAQELKKAQDITPESILGRIDGDIFCFCSKVSASEKLTPTVNGIEQFLEGYREDYRFNISVGLYMIHDTSESLRDIYAKATLAARKCKDNSTLHYALYDEEMDKEIVNQQVLSSEMHKALKSNEFVVYFQPKVDLKTQKLVGAEALVRWKHPVKGIIPPSEFIPIFYKNGFISHLDFYVFESVCASIKKWKSAGLQLIPISINLTQVSMMDISLPEKLLSVMEKYGIEKEYIHLEITEGSYSVDTEKSIKCAKQFREKGIHLEMDDFGTGISSLTMLHELPIDTLKLDLRFVKDYEESKSNAGIIHFIVSLARQMELKLIAEGIETEHQLEFLKNIGCDIGQGFLFSKPVSEKDFEDLLQKWDTMEIIKTEKSSTLPIDMNDLWIPDSNFNVIFNTIAGAAAIYEVTTDVTSVKVLKMNDEYLQVMEVEKSGKHHTFADLLMLIQPEDLAELQKSLVVTLQTKQPLNMLIRRINVPGKDSPKWLKMGMRFLFQTLTSTLVLATLEDVTAQQEEKNYMVREAQIHEEYKKQLSIYNEAEQNGLATMCMSEKGLRLEYANDAFLELHGATREYAFLNADTFLMKTVHPDDTKTIMKAFETILKNKKKNFRWTMRTLSLNGKELATVVNGAIRYTEEGVFADIVVRELKKAESVSFYIGSE